MRDLAEAVARVIPGTEISINKNAQPDKRSYRVNFDLDSLREQGFLDEKLRWTFHSRS